MIFKKIYNNTARQMKWLLWGLVTRFPLQIFTFSHLRPWVWRKVGARLGKNVKIGFGTYLDVDNAHMLEIGDNTMLAPECFLLLHRRDLSSYYKGMDCQKVPHISEKIQIGENVQIGSRCVIMPGVKIGDGAVIGSGSVVVKDIPSWSIAVGNPAKVIKEIKENPNI